MSFLDDFPDFSFDEPSHGTDSEFDDSRESFIQTPKKTSTPRKSVTPRKSGKSTFKVPVVPMPIFSCEKCRKKFRSTQTLKKHLRSHVLKEAASRTITPTNVESAFQSSVELVLSQMTNPNDVPESSRLVASFKEHHNSADSLKCFKNCVCCVLCEGLVGKSFLMPSAMWGSLLCDVNKALNSAETKSALKTHILNFRADLSPEVRCTFVLEFSQKIAATVCAVITRKMAEAAGVQAPEERTARSSDDFSTVQDQSTAFHIFGFVIKQFCRKALSSRKSKYWNKILDVIQTRFVKGGLVVSCPEGIEAWTASLSRGSLIYVGDNAFNFFIELARVIQGMEKRDGSLDHEAVLVKVLNTPAILTLWDNFIGNDVNQDDAYTFLSGIVKSTSNVVGVGIQDRRLNEEVSRGSVNAGLRSSLAPKQSAGSSKS